MVVERRDAASQFGDRKAYLRTRPRSERQPLNERLVRPGCQHMQLDKSKTEGKVRFPFTPKRKRKKESIEEAKKQYAELVRIGHVSMVQIGEDEFRSPTRRERRHAGIRRRGKSPMTHIALKKGTAGMGKRTIRVPITDRTCERREIDREIRQFNAETGGPDAVR